MRAVFHLLFIATYLVSSYATTQHRVASILQDLQRNTTQGAKLDDEKVRPHYTNFREAKKIDTGFKFVLTSVSSSFQLLSIRRLLVQNDSAKPVSVAIAGSSRAPPLTAPFSA
jgi:hypothetical protein